MENILHSITRFTPTFLVLLISEKKKHERTDYFDWGSMLMSRCYITVVQLLYYYEVNQLNRSKKRQR